MITGTDSTAAAKTSGTKLESAPIPSAPSCIPIDASAAAAVEIIPPAPLNSAHAMPPTAKTGAYSRPMPSPHAIPAKPPCSSPPLREMMRVTKNAAITAGLKPNTLYSRIDHTRQNTPASSAAS